jgi:hypothetical protein
MKIIEVAFTATGGASTLTSVFGAFALAFGFAASSVADFFLSAALPAALGFELLSSTGWSAGSALTDFLVDFAAGFFSAALASTLLAAGFFATGFFAAGFFTIGSFADDSDDSFFTISGALQAVCRSGHTHRLQT